MKKDLSVLFTVLFFGMLVVGSASAVTFTVDDDGTPGVDYPDLQTALSTAAGWGGSGHIIEIKPGSYSDVNLTVPANVAEIVAVAAKGEVVFTAPTAGSGYFLDVSGTTDLVISGLDIIDYNEGIVTNSAIATGLDFSGCLFDNVNYGVNGTFTGSTFDGLEMFNGIEGFYFVDNFGGSSMDNNTVMNTMVYDMTGHGIRFYGGGAASFSGNSVTGCTVYNCQSFGIILGAGGGSHSNTTISDNLVYNTTFEGVVLGLGTGNSVTGNEVYGCAFGTLAGDGVTTRTPLGGMLIKGAGQVTDNVVYNNGDGAGVGDYGIYATDGTTSFQNNCLYGHANAAQAYDNTTVNYWNNNYYGAYVSDPHLIDGGDRKDWNPKLLDNSAIAAETTWEVYQVTNNEYVVEFMWSMPDCDPYEEVAMSAYNFTVNYDDSKLEYVSGEYDEGFFGPLDGSTGAVYAPIVTGTGTVAFAASNAAEPGTDPMVLARATFQVEDVGATAITISSEYLDAQDPPVEFTVGNTPLNLTLVDTQTPEMVSVSGPSVVTDDDATPFGDVTPVKLEVEASATDNFDLRRIRYRIDAGGTSTLVGGLSGTSGGTTAPVAINTQGLAEGSHILYVWVEDQAGNFSAEVEHPFEIDRTPPVVDLFEVYDADGCAPTDAYTDMADITVAITNGDMTGVGYQLSHGSGFGSVIAYSPTGGADEFTYTLPGTGSYTVYTRLYDAVGNVTAYSTDNITYDDTAPNPSNFFIESDAAKTNNPVLSCDANFDAPNGAMEYNVSLDAADLVCGDAGWTAAPVHPFSFDLGSGAADGTYELFFAVRDDAGNISTILSDDIVLDQTAPEVDALTLDDCLDTRISIPVTIDWTDDDVTMVYFSINGNSDPTYNFAITDASTGTETFTFTFRAIHLNTDDNNVISAYLVDDIGNTGAAFPDVDFFYDQTDPTISGVVMADPGAGSDPPTNPNYSATLDVDVMCSGLADDIVEFHVSETDAFAGEEVVYTATGPYTAGEYTFTHTYGTAGATTPITECASYPIYVKVFDCAGRNAGSVNDNIRFDFTDPVINSVTITSANPANVLDVDLALDVTDNCQWYKMNIYEVSKTTAATGWINDAATYTYTLDPGDGQRDIMVDVSDGAGHTATFGPVSVMIDQLPPQNTAAHLWQPGNPHVTTGYTNSLTGVQIVVDESDDAAEVRFRETASSNISSWMAVPATYDIPWTLASGQGTKTVEFNFRDAAGNFTGWTPMTIEFDNVPPSAPMAGSATGTPGGSVLLEWGAVSGANKYYIRYTYTNDYPAYTDWATLDILPLHPNFGEGFEAGFTSDTEFDFVGHQMDIYAFSIWTYDMAGNRSTDYNTDVTSTNYIVSDLGNDGVVEFGADIGALGASYNQYDSDPYYDAQVDYGLDDVVGVPKPDGYIGFDELVEASQAYAVFGDWLTPKAAPVEPQLNVDNVVVSVEVPELLASGEEFTTSVDLSNPQGIMAYHVVLNYDSDKLEIVDIESGEMFNTRARVFDYKNSNGNEILLDGAVFGGDAVFTDSEAARIKFRAKEDLNQVEMTRSEIDIRDREGYEINSTFKTEVKVADVLPTTFALYQNYPNPFNPSTVIKMALPRATEWSLDIYNITGRKVASFNGYNEAGVHEIVWDASGLASGIYFYKLNAGEFVDTRKMTLLK